MVHSVQKKNLNAPQRDKKSYEQAHVCRRQGIGKKWTNEQTKNEHKKIGANNKGRRRIDVEQNVENAQAIANERKINGISKKPQSEDVLDTYSSSPIQSANATVLYMM